MKSVRDSRVQGNKKIYVFLAIVAYQSIVFVLLGCGGSIMISVFTSSIPMFIVWILIFFGFNALYIPLLQELSVKEDRGTTLAGMYNAMKSLGMIVGALYAGFIYGVHEKLPFIIAGILFFITVGILIGYNRCTLDKGTMR